MAGKREEDHIKAMKALVKELNEIDFNKPRGTIGINKDIMNKRFTI